MYLSVFEYTDVGRESRDVDTTGIIAGVVIGLGMPLLIALILSVLIVMFFVHAYKSVKKPTTKNGYYMCVAIKLFYFNKILGQHKKEVFQVSITNFPHQCPLLVMPI